MNELIDIAAHMWLTNKKEMLSEKRHQYINRARHTFVLLALLRGYSKEQISSFTGWNFYKVNYYASKALTEQFTIKKILSKSIIALNI